jgi:hypothetical protein
VIESFVADARTHPRRGAPGLGEDRLPRDRAGPAAARTRRAGRIQAPRRRRSEHFETRRPAPRARIEKQTVDVRIENRRIGERHQELAERRVEYRLRSDRRILSNRDRFQRLPWPRS